MKFLISLFKESKLVLVIFAIALISVGALVATSVVNRGENKYVLESSAVVYSDTGEKVVQSGDTFEKR
jgi:hypothetical protein